MALCYKDRSYCRAWASCKHGSTCVSALTDKIVKEADKFGLPVDSNLQFSCFEKIEKGEENEVHDPISGNSPNS
jgi:hypothetical protein